MSSYITKLDMFGGVNAVAEVVTEAAIIKTNM